MALRRVAIRGGLLLGLFFSLLSPAVVAQETAAAPAQQLYSMLFPVDGPHSFVDTFGAPRSGNRLHQGIDIFADKLTPVVAVANGTIRTVAVGERAGRYIVIEHDDGWESYYIHLNNDSAGTDDGLRNEWLPGVKVGERVAAGDLLDYVGDSGNAEETPPHLHFELHRPDGETVNPYPHLLAAAGAPAARVDEALEEVDEFLPKMQGTAVVGHLDPGDGFAAGVAVHGDTAYMGTWGRPQACPATGVRVIDVADPTEPEIIAALASGEEFPETDTDSVWVGSIATDSFSGDVAVVAISLCDNREPQREEDLFRGLAVYDVTTPASPVLLGTIDSGPVTQGVHELDVVARADGRVLVAATVMQSLRHTTGTRGDVRLIEITDPSQPVELADWDFRREIDGYDGSGLLPPEQKHAHSVAFAAAGTRLWVAHWDAGAVLLDISEPTQPTRAAWVDEAASAEGNVHSVISDPGSGLVVLSSEDFHPDESADHEPGWGHQTILDLIGRPLGTFALGAADATPPRDGLHTAHEAKLSGDTMYAAWYSSGVRIVDLSDPAAPVETGYFVPPPNVDPQGYWTAPDGTNRFPMVWDVVVADDLLYVSDMHSGLWIVRELADGEVIGLPY